MQDGPAQRVAGGEVYPVRQEPLIIGEPRQPLGSSVVGGTFAHVDVNPHTELICELGSRLECLVAAREGGVDPHPATTP